MIYPVILCGGSGTRLWPSSRKAYPKQFVNLLGDQSLFQRTLGRFTGPAFAEPLIVTGEDFRFIAIDQALAAGLSDLRVVVEPQARDTAAAVLAAALILAKDDPDALMLVAPSDHVIADPDGFRAAVEIGAKAAGAGALVTFGVTPNAPETGFGYLELGEDAKDGIHPVASFREKPDAETAASFVAAGNYLWNAGLFLLRAKDAIAAFETHAPDLLDPVKAAIAGGAEDLGFFRLGAEGFGAARATSFDFAVMEKAENVMAVPLDVGWSDLGSWEAIWQSAEPDENGVALSGPATGIDCQNSYLRSESDGLELVGLGLTDIIAVAMPDAVLVASRERAQDLKDCGHIAQGRKGCAGRCLSSVPPPLGLV